MVNKQKNKKMSTLTKWMKDNNITMSVLSKKVGVCPATIHSYVYGKTTPSLEVAHRIERLTGGAVAVHHWTDYKPTQLFNGSL